MIDRRNRNRALKPATIVLSILVAGGAAPTTAPTIVQPAPAMVPHAPMTIVTVVNATRTVIVGLQVKSARSDAWAGDLLNNKTLGVQKQMSLSLLPVPGCIYDIRCRFEDGRKIMKKHVNLCARPIYRLTDF